MASSPSNAGRVCPALHLYSVGSHQLHESSEKITVRFTTFRIDCNPATRHVCTTTWLASGAGSRWRIHGSHWGILSRMRYVRNPIQASHIIVAMVPNLKNPSGLRFLRSRNSWRFRHGAVVTVRRAMRRTRAFTERGPNINMQLSPRVPFSPPKL